MEDWGIGISLGSGSNPGSTESNANRFYRQQDSRERHRTARCPRRAAPDIFSYGNTFEGNLYGADLEGNAIFKDFGSHFENGNANIPGTPPTVCGGATPAPVEIVNCASSVETLTTGFYGVM